MAELNFYLTIKERNLFFKYCFEKGCFLIPNVHYPQKKYIVLKSIKELEEYNDCVQFFIFNHEYSKYPLEFGSFDRDGVEIFFVRQRYGGPTIDFASPIFAEIKNNKIGPGSISIYPFYYIGNEKNNSIDEIRIFYNDFVGFIKKMCRKVKLPYRTYWIGKETIELAKVKKVEIIDINGEDMLEIALKHN